MLSKDAENIQESLRRIAKISGKISLAFKVAFVVVVAFAGLFLCSSIIGLFAPTLLPFDETPVFGFNLIPDLLFSSICGVILFVIMRVFEDISKGESPFTSNQARRLCIIGWLLTIGVVLDAVVSMNTFSAMRLVGFDLGYVSSPQAGTDVYINSSYLIGAIVSFCLSYVFKYGALLQRLSDGTV